MFYQWYKWQLACVFFDYSRRGTFEEFEKEYIKIRDIIIEINKSK